ncbi:hypothetical protein GCM10028775_77700 [Catellatospora paridis]
MVLDRPGTVGLTPPQAAVCSPAAAEVAAALAGDLPKLDTNITGEGWDVSGVRAMPRT